jgi:hypothetical protein
MGVLRKRQADGDSVEGNSSGCVAHDELLAALSVARPAPAETGGACPRERGTPGVLTQRTFAA